MSRPMGDRIPDKILKEIFPEKLNRSLASEKVYSHLKQMIVSGKVKKDRLIIVKHKGHLLLDF